MSFAEKVGISEIRKVYSWSQKKSINRLIISLPGSGCQYYKTKGGCSMCGFHNETKKFSHGFLYPFKIFKILLESSLKLVHSREISEIYIFNGGSFLNDKEIPLKFQKYVFKRVSELKVIKVIFIESRIEYISEKKLQLISSLKSQLEIKIAIGFESQNDYIRNKIIKKSLSKKSFERTIFLISQYNLKSCAYVFLKPLKLTEKEALQEAQKTISYLNSLNVSEIILSVAFVQKNTEMYKEYLNGNYRPPYLWTLISLIEHFLRDDIPLSVGGFSDKPKPIAITKNCDLCSNDIYLLLDEYRKYNILNKIPQCDCYKKYKQLIL